MDFKADGAVLMVGTSDLDLSFISSEDGSTLPDRKGRNGEWATSTVPFGLRFQGRPGQSTALGPGRSSVLRGVFGIESVRGRQPLRFHGFTPVPVHGEVPVPSPYQATAPASPGPRSTGTMAVSAGLTDGCLLVWKVESEEVEDDAPPTTRPRRRKTSDSRSTTLLRCSPDRERRGFDSEDQGDP